MKSLHFAVLLSLCSRLVGQDPIDAADQLFQRYDKADEPGVVAAVFQEGETLYARAYGMANLAYDLPIALDTPSNIGSTSKQFTAFAIMLLQEEGALSLDDDLRDHLPELPNFDKTVTIRHLLTHTSGYRDFLTNMRLSGRNLGHGDFIERETLIEVIQRQPELQNEPGAQYNYNNTGYGLAAMVVERVSGLSFPEFLAQRVFAPLHMENSRVRPSPEHIIPGAAIGYAREGGNFLEKRDLWAAIGAGSIYTTVGDLQKWIENMADPIVGTAAIFDQMMTPNLLTDGNPSGYGLGLLITDQNGHKIVLHGGADIAHRSQLVYIPSINAGVTTQSNRADFDSGLAMQLVELFFGDDLEGDSQPTQTATEGHEIEMSTEAFDAIAGRYALDAAPSFVLTVFREDDNYFVQATGQQKLPIRPTSTSSFVIEGVDAKLAIHQNEDGAFETLTLHQGGPQPATRIPEKKDGPAEDSGKAMDLSPYLGRYFCQELECFYTIEQEEGDDLSIRSLHRKAMSLHANDKKTFTGAEGMRLLFEFDSKGTASGFSMSAGRSRGILAQRVQK